MASQAKSKRQMEATISIKWDGTQKFNLFANTADKCEPSSSAFEWRTKVVQSLYQLTNSIQKQHSPHLRLFVEGEIQFVGYTDQDDKLHAMLTLKKRKNVEIGLDQITSLILAFFIGNTSLLMDLGKEYKWCPAGNIMGSTWCGIYALQKLCCGGR